jgi:hypothetical protein
VRVAIPSQHTVRNPKIILSADAWAEGAALVGSIGGCDQGLQAGIRGLMECGTPEMDVVRGRRLYGGTGLKVDDCTRDQPVGVCTCYLHLTRVARAPSH